MTKAQHKRTALASMLQNSISRNTKCAERDGFHREDHIILYANQLSHNFKQAGLYSSVSKHQHESISETLSNKSSLLLNLNLYYLSYIGRKHRVMALLFARFSLYFYAFQNLLWHFY